MNRSLSKRRIKIGEEVMSNEDLLLQVLLCLPAKSLIRFKSVSKHWRSLISDPKFCSKHTQLNLASPTLGIYFVYQYDTTLRSVSLNHANQKDIPTLAHIKDLLACSDSNMPDIVHACNGLFLCSHTPARPYLICNFTSRTFTILPQHPLPTSGHLYNKDSAYLVFDPSKTQYFKVVLLNVTMYSHNVTFHHEDEFKGKTGYCGSDLCYEIDVYSSETGIWKRIYFRAPHRPSYLSCKAVCNGSLHWITMDKFHGRFEVDKTELIFNHLPLKPKTLDPEKVRYFGESSGHLFLICILWRSVKKFNVLELDKDHSSWTMKYRVDMSPLMAYFPDSFQIPDQNGNVIRRWNFSVLCVVKEKEINGFSMLLAIPGRIVSYNLNMKTFRVLDELAMHWYHAVSGSYTYTYTFPFMANLSLV